MIVHHAASDTWFLHGATTSYALRVLPSGHLAQVHWGARIEATAIDWFPLSHHRVFSPYPPELFDAGFTPDVLPQEAPTGGSGDFRQPMLGVRLADGSQVLDLRVTGAVVRPGKPALPGLPATYAEDPAEASTLVVTLADPRAGLRLELRYTVFHGTDVLARSWSLTNTGTHGLVLDRALSASVDLPHSDGTLLHLAGAWARECDVVRRALTPGIAAIESRRGSSSPQHNPFIALLAPDAGEEHGEVWAMHLVYSGNFLAQAEVDQSGQTRLQIGINPAQFAWELAPGGVFHAPEAILARSQTGLGGLSRSLHRLYRTRLARGPWRDRPRPVLLNNWEATYFDFTTERLLRLAEAGKRIGCDLFVLDDGWFGNRVNDRAGLGDWTQVNETKLPGGLRPLAEGVNALGMRFGLWFEPEMVNVDSDLYRAHPDWCLHVPGRTRTEGRHQLALDVGRAEVREHVWRCLETVLRSAPIGYVKWDMNRHLTEVWAPDLPAHRQGEVAHRYILGVYELFDRLNRTFPDLLIENCASGGGRFDPGMMHYAPQTWCSDNSDAIARLRIQHGTTIAYPPSAVGAHVSIVPNHQVHRTTPLFTRAVVATTGAFGYELDLLRLGDDELARMRALTDRWRELEPLVRTGDLYRLIDPAAGRWAAWMQVAADRGQALVSCVRILAEANAPRRQLRLAGLDATATYRVEPRNETGAQPAFLARGDALMAVGLRLDAGKNQPIPAGDFTACTWHLVRV